MAISLITNTGSLESQSRLSVSASKLNNTIQRLSSGLRINSSGDDAAGLAIANTYRSNISRLQQGVRNANDGVSTLQIVDGGLNTISGLLDRAGVLASQAASDTFSGDRATLQAEFVKVKAEITRQAENIGLGTNAGQASRFAKNISVFIGGGTDAAGANNTISVDLSSNSEVDSVGLQIDSLDLDSNTGTAFTGANAVTTLGQAETLTFKFNDSTTGTSITLASGDDIDDVVAKINANEDLKAAGVVASKDGSDNLVLSGTKSSYRVSSDVASGTADSLGINATVNTDSAVTYESTSSGARSALSSISAAIQTLGEVQGKVGAGQNNLAQAIDLATTQITNFQAAESRIRDADIAAEASDLARLTTLQQAGVAALAQANQSSQAVLSLLR